MAFSIAEGYVELSEKGLSSVEGAIGSVTEKFKGLLSPMGLVSEGLAALGAGAGIGGMLSMAMGLSRVRTGFDELTRSAGMTDELLGQLKRQFSGTSISVESYRAAARELLQLGTAAKDIPGRLQTLGNIAAATGEPLDAMAGALRRMEITGKVTSRTIFMLGPSIQDALQKAYPAFENLAEAADKGQIGIKQIQAAIDSLGGTGGQFAGAMAAQQDDMLGHWERLKEGVVGALTRIGEWIYHAFDLGAVSDNLAAFADRFVNEWGAKLQQTLKAVKTKAQELWEFIAKHKEAEISIAAMSAGFVAVKEAIGAAVKVVKWLAAAHATVTAAMKTQTVWAAILAALSGQWQNLVAASLVAAALGAYELYSWLHKAAEEKAALAQPIGGNTPGDSAAADERANRNSRLTGLREELYTQGQIAAMHREYADALGQTLTAMEKRRELIIEAEAWIRRAREQGIAAAKIDEYRVAQQQKLNALQAEADSAAKRAGDAAEAAKYAEKHAMLEFTGKPGEVSADWLAKHKIGPPELSIAKQTAPHAPDQAAFVGLSQLAEKMQTEAVRQAEMEEQLALQKTQAGHLGTVAGAVQGDAMNVRLVNPSPGGNW